MSDGNSENSPESNWQYTADSNSPETVSASNQTSEVIQEAPDVTWSASEYIAHEKDIRWYIVAALLILGFALLIFLLDSNHGWFSPIIVIIMGIAFIVTASRKPKVLNYAVDSAGLHAGSRNYRFSEFKSFSVVQEGPIETIVLMPLKRFMPGMTIYFEPKDQDKIVESLMAYLPYENRKLDPIDNLMRKIRF